MRSIFAAIIMLSASTAVVHTAQAQRHAQTQPSYGDMQAPVGHRQPTRDDVTGDNQVDKESVAKDNELFDLPTNQDKVIGAEQVESEENALAKRIEQENARLDRELRGICRGLLSIGLVSLRYQSQRDGDRSRKDMRRPRDTCADCANEVRCGSSR